MSPTGPTDSSTFRPGFRLLPRPLRADVGRLYHLLRTLDDLVDEDQPQAAQRVEAVERWAHDETIDTPETQALTELTLRYRLPRRALLDFCEGMRHDIARKTIDTEEDLELYCQRVGGSVGILITHLLGTNSPDGEAKMATLGRAVQRTNILRDIDEDAAHNRLYIARSTIERFGAPTPGARSELLRDQIIRADTLYEQAADASSLAHQGQQFLALSTDLYREILRQIERDGYGRQPGRAVVPAWRKRLLTAKHCLKRDQRHTTTTRPPNQ